MESIPGHRREWGVLEAALEDRIPFEVSVDMHPAQAQVREALHLHFSLSPIEKPWKTGTELLVLVPKTWKLDLNGAFPEMSKFFALWEGGYGNGRQCLVAAMPSAAECTAQCALLPAGFEFLIYVRIEEIELRAFKIVSLLRYMKPKTHLF